MKIGVFDNTNYNYMLKFLRENFSIDLVNDFKIYNAFSYKNMIEEYDILLILSNITDFNKEKIEHVIKKTKVLIINGDDKELYKIIENNDIKDVYIITYGFNAKSTLTISSIDKFEKKVICVLQRSINDIYNRTIEPREVYINKGDSNFNNNKLLGIITLLLILGYNDNI